ncbi:MAG TPA: DUF5691 domain-containing protein [Verrucomicrobiales bacterium]|nr:DUF5691 domain-containing protein [Verrucomicrobiales bacterium]
MASALTQLSASALVGLSRKPPAWPAVPGGIGELLASMEGTEPEAQFLRTAGVLAFAAEAGQEPAVVAGTLEAAPAEEVKSADSPRLRTAIGQLIASGPAEILIELLELLAQKRRTLPREYLPALLATSTNKPALRAAIAKLPGQRHRWLASLNPDWQGILTEAIHTDGTLDERLWTDGSTPERVAVLRQIRLREPARAREMLAPVLTKEAAKERLEMLAVMSECLSPDDEAFLNTTLADKSKGVRQLAAEYLSRLPQSAHAQRMQARLAEILTIDKKLLRSAKLEVSLPEKLDPAWAKDGIEEKPVQGEGAKACWLRQAVTFTPVAWWEKHSGLKAPEIISLMAKSDWAAPLLTGLAAAVIAQGEKTWAAALVAHGPVPNVFLNFPAIAAVAGAAATEQWLTALSSSGEYSEALGHALSMESWTETFAKEMLSGARKVAAKEPHYIFYIHFPSLALRLPVSCLKAGGENWEALLDRPYLRNALDAFLQNIQLRKAIHEELSTLSP